MAALKILNLFSKKACILEKPVLLYWGAEGLVLRKIKYPGVAKFGIALEWGSRGLEFESRHSDHIKTAVVKTTAVLIF